MLMFAKIIALTLFLFSSMSKSSSLRFAVLFNFNSSKLALVTVNFRYDHIIKSIMGQPGNVHSNDNINLL